MSMSIRSRAVSDRLRAGSVPYLVARPLDLRLQDEPSIALEHHVPSELVARLRSCELDVALVSSIELFRRPGYRYLSNLAVAGSGFVSSVQLFLRSALEDVHSIAVDPSSRTAATLVRILAAEGLSHTDPDDLPALIRFLELDRDGDPRAAQADAWLCIGDRALREYHQRNAPPVLNPSLEWNRRTGLPFIFAVWIVRPGIELEPRHLEAFARAHARGMREREELAVRASSEWCIPLEACRTYLFDECLFDPSAAELERSLRAFRDRAAPLGLCSANLEPQSIEGVASDVT